MNADYYNADGNGGGRKRNTSDVRRLRSETLVGGIDREVNNMPGRPSIATFGTEEEFRNF